MKIKTILGVLLILALVMGSTGVAVADDQDQIQDRVDWIDTDGDGIGDVPLQDGTCDSCTCPCAQ